MFKRPTLRPGVFHCLPLVLLSALTSESQTLYQFGNPTAEEQSYIELINRARANPLAEGARLATTTAPDVLAAYTQYGVNLTMMQNEFNAIAAAQPLAPNAALTSAARSHSQWMLNNATQSHDETNPSNTTQQRITNAGYIWSTIGENIYAYSSNVWYGHAGFQVDWGPGGTGGMQSGRGHRANIHRAAFKEIGAGVVNGTNGAIGPQLVTQDLGAPSNGQTFGTGVAYYDLNANNFYDIGEGIAGLTVNVSGTTNYCTTAIGGGWVVPIPNTATTRTVTFSGLGINQNNNLTVPASTNAKTDLKLTYSPPSITSAATATSGNLHTFAFTAVGGATGYKWNRWNTSAALSENCNALTNVTVTTTSAYPVLNTSVKQEGTSSFHLANPGTIGNQIVELNSLYHGQASASLAFQSRLRNSTSSEHHKVQVKEEGSAAWQDVYNQDGGTVEASFSSKTVLLPTMAGKKFRVRFILNFPGGSTYGDTGDIFGWFIDAISFNNISTLSSNVSQTLAGTGGTFTPSTGNYLMSVAPVISGIEFSSTSQSLAVTAPTPSFVTWASSIETANSLAAGTIGNNANGDHDKDGRTNLVEYAFGTSPVSGNEAAPRMPALQASASHFVVRYTRDTTLTDLTLVPVASPDFATWKSPGQPGAPAGFTDSPVSTAGNLETREAKIPRSAGAKWFMSLRITRP
ncbi:MAG: CAP domain-containing protein [Verrucomicrobiota bacterium]